MNLTNGRKEKSVYKYICVTQMREPSEYNTKYIFIDGIGKCCREQWPFPFSHMFKRLRTCSASNVDSCAISVEAT